MDQKPELSEQTGQLEPEKRYGEDWEAIRAGKLSKKQYIAERIASDEENKKKEAELAELARKDPLTGLDNRRAFYEEMEKAAAIVRRTDKPACLLAVDIDGFSNVNSEYGHDGGDEALRRIATTLTTQVRPTDSIFRAGEHGDEFMIIVPETDIPGSLVLGERIRDTIENLGIVFRGNTFSVKVSLGISLFDPLSSPEETMKKADNALYNAKNAGRNTVKIYGEALEDHS